MINGAVMDPPPPSCCAWASVGPQATGSALAQQEVLLKRPSGRYYLHHGAHEELQLHVHVRTAGRPIRGLPALAPGGVCLPDAP